MDPYPLPRAWRTTPARPRSITATTLLGATCVLLAVGLWVALAADQALIAIVFVLFLLALSVGMAVGGDRSGGERARPELINALALTRAETQPIDSWVYFFRQRTPTLTSALWLIAGGGVSVIASGVLIARSLQVGGTALLALIGLVPLALAAAVVVLAGSNTVGVRSRARWFARRPRGLAVGRSGVTLYSLDAVTFDTTWSWDEIVEIEPEAIITARGGNVTPRLRLGIRSPGATEVERFDVPVSELEAHAWLVYSTLRFWSEHPDLRDDLDTSRAQERMEHWMTALAPTADTRRDEKRS
ncbi:MAG: hypothetical protein PIR02_19185 [Microbacterium enclense]